MKREVMEAAGLEAYAELGIIIFLVAFAAIVVRTLFMNANVADQRGRLPLDDGSGDSMTHG